MAFIVILLFAYAILNTIAEILQDYYYIDKNGDILWYYDNNYDYKWRRWK